MERILPPVQIAAVLLSKLMIELPNAKSMTESSINVSAPVPGEEPSMTSPLKAILPPFRITAAVLLIRSFVPTSSNKSVPPVFTVTLVFAPSAPALPSSRMVPSVVPFPTVTGSTNVFGEAPLRTSLPVPAIVRPVLVRRQRICNCPGKLRCHRPHPLG